MSVWDSTSTEKIVAATGLPGDEPLELTVETAIGWTNRTRIIANNSDIGIEILVNPDNLTMLIEALTAAQTRHIEYATQCIMSRFDPTTEQESDGTVPLDAPQQSESSPATMGT